jgi:urease alpha subunit
VHGTRGLTRSDLVANHAAPSGLEVSAADGTVTLDGKALSIEPTAVVPLSRRYLLA